MQPSIHTLLGLILLLAFAPLAFSQQGSAQPCPDVTPGTLGCELVAWSHLQEPVPLPESETKPAPPPEQQPGQSPNSQTQPQASRQRITGIIVRQGEKYVLKAGDNTTYQLDDQDRAGRYQDKQVMVVGRLDPDSNTFHIESIELAS
jgi:Protein of unknown function (DUF5818)